MKYWLNSINRVDVMPRPGGHDLRYSEWTSALPESLFRKFIETLIWEDFALYPDTTLLANKIAELNCLETSNIFLAPGSAECIKTVFDCLMPMQSVTTTYPCFPMYDVYAQQNNLFIEHVWPNQSLHYNADQFVTGNLIVIARPSSPLGTIFSKSEIEQILQHNPARLVLVDEAYINYAEGAEDISSLVLKHRNLIISRSFSKVFGAAGCRVGYLMSCEDNIKMISKLRQMYQISGPSQRYAMFLLDNQSEIEAYCQNTISERKKLCNLFRSAKLNVVSSQGNWIHIEQSDDLINFLKENNIHTKTNISLPYSDLKWVRLTVGPTVSDIFKEFFHEGV